MQPHSKDPTLRISGCYACKSPPFKSPCPSLSCRTTPKESSRLSSPTFTFRRRLAYSHSSRYHTTGPARGEALRDGESSSLHTDTLLSPPTDEDHQQSIRHRHRLRRS